MRVASSLVVLVMAAACADLKDIISLQRDLAREFETPAIGVNINNSVHLTITFSNSPAAVLPDAEQAAFARRVAEYVRDHYVGYDRLQTISVGFATVKGGGPVRFTTTRVPYRFSPDQLGPPRRVKERIPAKAAA